jgi:hypothetical protein
VDGLWGYINDAGEVVIPAEFDEAADFHAGVAIVKRGAFKCVIDKDGEYLIACAMDEIISLDGDILRLEKENKMAYFDLRTKKYMWQPVGF